MVELSPTQIDECTRDIKRKYALSCSLHLNGFETTVFNLDEARLIWQICQQLDLNLCAVNVPGVILIKALDGKGMFKTGPMRYAILIPEDKYEFNGEDHYHGEYGDMFEGLVVGDYELAIRDATPRSGSHEFVYVQVLGLKKTKKR